MPGKAKVIWMESTGIWATEWKTIDGVERHVTVGTNHMVEGAR